MCVHLMILFVLSLACLQVTYAATNVITSSDLTTIYNGWKQDHVDEYTVSWKGNPQLPVARVKWVGGSGWSVPIPQSQFSASESIGYGALISVYNDDSDLFSRLINFYDFVVESQQGSLNALMPWLVNGGGSPVASVGGNGPATDGDIDVAMALLVASGKGWGTAGYYQDRALQIIDVLKNQYFEECDGTWVMKPGDFGGCSGESCANEGDGDVHDVSYYAPGYFRYWAAITGDGDWNEIADATYEHIKRVQSIYGGVLVPDFQSVSGAFSCKRNQNYAFDASRTPWRIGIDHLWWGTPSARADFLDLANWFARDKEGITNIQGPYAVNMSNNKVPPTYHNIAFVGGFACGMVAAKPEDLDNFATELKGLMITAGGSYISGQYFDATLGALYALTVTGQFVKP